MLPDCPAAERRTTLGCEVPADHVWQTFRLASVEGTTEGQAMLGRRDASRTKGVEFVAGLGVGY